MKKTQTHHHIIRIESLPSTNKYAKNITEISGLPEGTVIYTDNQISGKGLSNNQWESEPFKNLTFSIIYHPVFLPPEKQVFLNMAMALGITDFIKQVSGKLKVKIKWPNDIYIHDKKVAGILIENIITGSVLSTTIVGIGINVNQIKFVSNAPNPTSLKIETRVDYELNDCFSILLECVDNRYEMLRQGNEDNINKDYLKSLYRFGRFFNYKYKNKIITAKMTGVSKWGMLQLITKDKSHIECDIKEIEFII